MSDQSTLDRIFDEAMCLFVEDGFSASINKLVQRTGIAKGTFYHYFKSKEELILALYKRLMFQIERECVSNYLQESAKDYSQKTFAAIVKWFISHPERFYYITVFETSPYIKKVIGRVEETMTGPRNNIMLKVSLGLMKSYPTDLIAFFDFSFTRTLANYFLASPNPMASFNKEFEMAFGLYWKGVSVE